MAEFPKIVRERLRQAGPEPHPDANLIAAFVENALTARERAEVLQHLAHCADCRAVTGFALPEPEAVLPQPRTAEQKRWARWTIMRWATLAASAIVIAIAVLVLRPQFAPVRNGHGFPRVSEPLPSVAAPAAKPQIPAEARAKEEAQKPVAPEAKTRTATGTAGKLEVPLHSRQAEGSAARREMDSAAARADADKDVLSGAKAASGYVAATPQQSRDYASLNQAQQQRVGGPYKNLANQAQNVTQQNTNAAAPPPPPPLPTRAVTAAPVPTAPQVPKKQEQPVAGVVGGAIGGPQAETAKTAAKFKAAEPAQNEVTVETAAAALRMRKGALADINTRPTRWTVSEKGQLLRSFDQGGTWTEIPVASGIVFRAISANGADVWAGGNAGALFHSADGGAHWTRVRPATQGAELAADISRIEFSDALHGTVTSTGGDRWITADGGRTWSVLAGH